MPGKKIALLIGNNYTGTQYKLNGCQNDIIKFKPILINKFGYLQSDIKVLMDTNGFEYPTGANITKYFDWIYQQTLQANLIDEITIYYSGHGTNVRDLNGDEPDGKDECIVPYDFLKFGLITDDYIYNFLSKLKPVKKIICIFDSCNSASCTDLPYSFTIINNTLVKQFYSKRQPIQLNPNIFVLSGCLDPKTSLDVREPDGTPCGLLSYWLRMTLAKYNYTCTIQNLITDIKKGFGSFDQTPVLSVNSNSALPSTKVFSLPTLIPVLTRDIDQQIGNNEIIHVDINDNEKDKKDKKNKKNNKNKKHKKKDNSLSVFNKIDKFLDKFINYILE